MITFLAIFLSVFLGLSCITKAYSEIDYNELFFTGQIENVSITWIENGFNIKLNTEGYEEGYYTAYFTPNENLNLENVGGAAIKLKNKAAEPLRINFSANDGVNEYKIQDNTKILKKNLETSVIEEAVCEYGTINMNEGEESIFYIPKEALGIQDAKVLYNFGFSVTTEASKNLEFEVQDFLILNDEEIADVQNIKPMKVIGDDEITIPSKGESMANYYVENLNCKAYFSVLEDAIGVYIDGDGNLHVKSSAEEGIVTIRIKGEDNSILYKKINLRNSWIKSEEGNKYDIPEDITAKDSSIIDFFTGESNLIIVRAFIVLAVFSATVLFLYWRKIINVKGKYIVMIILGFTLVLALMAGVKFFRGRKQEMPDISKTMNIGNALEAGKGEVWDVSMSVEYIDMIKKAGFTSIRMPVRFSDYAKDNENYILDEDFMEKVDYYINYALSSGLNVILDMHNFYEIMENPSENKELFLKLWSQISERYKDYPENLVYELLNEPQGNLELDIWNNLLSEGVDTIRKFDKKKFIVIGGCKYNSYEELLKIDVPKDDNLILTFHYYEPNEFAFQGAEYHEGFEELHDIQWKWTESEVQRIEDAFHKVKEFADKKNLNVFVGEFGANKKAPHESRVLWTKTVREIAEEHNFSWGYWEMASSFGIYDKDKHVFDDEMLEALLNTKEAG